MGFYEFASNHPILTFLLACVIADMLAKIFRGSSW